MAALTACLALAGISPLFPAPARAWFTRLCQVRSTAPLGMRMANVPRGARYASAVIVADRPNRHSLTGSATLQRAHGRGGAAQGIPTPLRKVGSKLVSYSVVRRQGVEETSTGQLEADSAVRLLRDWARAYPQQLLVIRDDAGFAVAYRRPGPLPAAAG